MSTRDLEKLIHAFIFTRLDYCNALYVGINKTLIKRLQLVQNTAARLLTGTRKRDHITPVLSSLNWLSIDYKINLKIEIFVYKSLHGMAPLYLANLIKKYEPKRSLRSADQLVLTTPRTKRRSGDRAFVAIVPKLWNDLPLSIRLERAFTVFKHKLKEYLLALAFNGV